MIDNSYFLDELKQLLSEEKYNLFLDALDKLSNMVYPLIAGNTKYPQTKNYNDYSRKNTRARIY